MSQNKDIPLWCQCHFLYQLRCTITNGHNF